MPRDMLRALGLLVVVTASSLCLGCPSPEPGPSEAEDCYALAPDDTSMLPSRTVELGLVQPNDMFRPYEDGELLELVGGFQGAEMITPYIELPALDSDGEAPCWWVKIDYHNDEYESVGNRGGYVFERRGDAMRVGPLFEQPYDFFGSTVTMRVTVVGDDFVAVDEVEVEIPDE